VSGFRLDKYLVTVGRFRQFVDAWSGGAGYTPPAGSGKHTHLNGGLGLANNENPGTYEPGWVGSDDSDIAPTITNLGSGAPYSTWTVSAGTQENLPINTITWQEAYAFCIWDGGFLPSEAEWEYAAAGGNQQREYPWGTTAPVTGPTGAIFSNPGNQYAIYACDYPSGSGICSGGANIAPVGTATLGAGLWGQLDMAGEELEWNLDWYASYAGSIDGANLTPASARVIRGGDGFNGGASNLLPPDRYDGTPAGRYADDGFRCARTP
jgi:formylglycine-generating enzyme required for sulfatase activity